MDDVRSGKGIYHGSDQITYDGEWEGGEMHVSYLIFF